MRLMSVGIRGNVGIDAGEVHLNVVNACRSGHPHQGGVFVLVLSPEADSDGVALYLPVWQVDVQHLLECRGF